MTNYARQRVWTSTNWLQLKANSLGGLCKVSLANPHIGYLPAQTLLMEHKKGMPAATFSS
jgi:hypothetical protein